MNIPGGVRGDYKVGDELALSPAYRDRLRPYLGGRFGSLHLTAVEDGLVAFTIEWNAPPYTRTVRLALVDPFEFEFALLPREWLRFAGLTWRAWTYPDANAATLHEEAWPETP